MFAYNSITRLNLWNVLLQSENQQSMLAIPSRQAHENTLKANPAGPSCNLRYLSSKGYELIHSLLVSIEETGCKWRTLSVSTLQTFMLQVYEPAALNPGPLIAWLHIDSEVLL